MDIALNLTTETVADAQPSELVIVDPTTSIADVFELMKTSRLGSLMVGDERGILGIFTERDALRLMADRWDLSQKIESVMVRDPVTIRADESVAQAIQAMSAGGYRRLPVVDGSGTPTGLLKVSSIVHYLVQHFPNTVYNQPPVSRVVMQEREGA